MCSTESVVYCFVWLNIPLGNALLLTFGTLLHSDKHQVRVDIGGLGD